MKLKQLGILSLFALTAIVSPSADVRADDDQAPQVKEYPLNIEDNITVVAQPASTHWIGVYAVPVEAALKSHLGIEDDCLIVRQVIDDSPAKKAGVQAHDVLLKFGDASIATVDNLIKAVDQSKGRPTSLALIRGGKKISLKVTAEKRPQNQLGIQVEHADLGDVRGLVEGWLKTNAADDPNGGLLKFHVVGPGVVDHRVNFEEIRKRLLDENTKLPKNLSIQINKSGDAPAKIKVTRDGETWEVTEENLDKLPEDVRPHIKRALGRQPGLAIGFAPGGQNMRLKALQVHPGQVIRSITPQAVQPPSAAKRAIQIFRAATDSDVDIEQLRQDVKELKAAVKKLQAGKSKTKQKDDD